MNIDINKEAKNWCSKHSNKKCTSNCSGCWQLRQGLGCEQHNMESAYIAGSINTKNRMWHKSDEIPRRGRYILVKPLDASMGEIFIAKVLSNGEYIHEDCISSIKNGDMWCYVYDILPNLK